ncbi:MAG TPA: D-glycerate dehydrogenase [Candidatus Baltobacteraceae bacterium]|nr:D-glycerate dehydrogenase [Candidatus Baltobacteraceae bacterium]
MHSPHFVVTTAVAPRAVEHLRAHARVTDVSALPRDEWDDALATADGVLIGSGTPVDARFVAAAPKLRIVASYSVGYDNVDLGALAARGIVLTNSRGSLDEAVADLTYALVIVGLRRLGLGIRWVRDGRWTQADMPYGHDLAGATLGLVGYGAIAQAVARRARVSGMRVIYFNRTAVAAADPQTGAQYRDFDALLAESDAVVALVPLTPQTRGMFDDDAFALMKPTAIFVNAARGAVADTAALLRALDNGKIAGAALDVTDPEPLPPGHPLADRDDVVVLPHIGSATVETRTRMAMVAAENLVAFAAGKPLLTPVNV